MNFDVGVRNVGFDRGVKYVILDQSLNILTVSNVNYQSPLATDMSESQRHISRRRVLKRVGAVGGSSTVLASLSGNVVGQNQEKLSDKKGFIEEYKITYPDGRLSPPTIDPVTGTVDRAYWREMMAAESAAARVREALDKNGLNERASVAVKTESSRQALIDPTISVQYNTAASLKNADIDSKQTEIEAIQDTVPKSARGQITDNEKTISRTFAVVVDRIQKKEPTATATADVDWDYDSKFRPVPGGCHIKMPNAHDDHGTLLFNMWHQGSEERYHITAAHVLAEGDKDNPDYSTRVYQPYNKGIGSTARKLCVYENNFEAGFVHPQSVDPGFDDTLANQDGSVTNDNVSYFKSWEWVSTTGKTTTITKQGARTGESSGSVYTSDSSNQTFWMSAEMGGGDSGGPSYVKESDGYKLVGMMLWSTADPQEAGGTAVARLNDDLGLYP